MEWWLFNFQLVMGILVIVLYFSGAHKAALIVCVVSLTVAGTWFLWVYWNAFPKTWWNGVILVLWLVLLVDVWGYYIKRNQKNWYFNKTMLIINASIVFIPSLVLAIWRTSFAMPTFFKPKIEVVFRSDVKRRTKPEAIYWHNFNETTSIPKMLEWFGDYHGDTGIFADAPNTYINIHDIGIKDPWEQIMEDSQGEAASYPLENIQNYNIGRFRNIWYGKDSGQVTLYISQTTKNSDDSTES